MPGIKLLAHGNRSAVLLSMIFSVRNMSDTEKVPRKYITCWNVSVENQFATCADYYIWTADYLHQELKISLQNQILDLKNWVFWNNHVNK